MGERVVYDVRNVMVGKRVQRFSAGSGDGDDSGESQRAEMLRHKWLRHPASSRQRTDRCGFGSKDSQQMEA
jgi:hypothetical protein